MKILKELQDDASQYQEFLQEVSIMRKVGQGRDEREGSAAGWCVFSAVGVCTASDRANSRQGSCSDKINGELQF